MAIKTPHYIIFFVRPLAYILSREWRVIVDQVQTNYHGRPMVLLSVRCDRAVDYDLIMRDPHYGRMCFKSVKTLGAIHS